jgi:hypothetical protein
MEACDLIKSSHYLPPMIRYLEDRWK